MISPNVMRKHLLSRLSQSVDPSEEASQYRYGRRSDVDLGISSCFQQRTQPHSRLCEYSQHITDASCSAVAVVGHTACGGCAAAHESPKPDPKEADVSHFPCL